jgi:hypothetical protein
MRQTTRLASPRFANRVVWALLRADGHPSRAGLIRYADSDLGTDCASYGHVPGPWSARADPAANMDSSPARPIAVMNLIEDRRRRSRME